MVYIDNNNLTPTDRNRLLPFLRNFLSVQLSPYDRAMLAVYDQGRFEIALPFTTEGLARRRGDRGGRGGPRQPRPHRIAAPRHSARAQRRLPPRPATAR